jgi:putative hydrolase of the HAD superfamily
MLPFDVWNGGALMIKTVFFDLYHTLITYDPPQEELVARALKDLGIEQEPYVFRRPLITADEFIYEEIARRPLSQRSQEEKLALYTQYQAIILKEAGIEADDKLAMGLLRKMQQYNTNLVLFDDVPPALDDLKTRGMVLGLISNVEQDMNETLTRLNLDSWLDIIVTSLDAGAGKPQPEIFREALRRAGVHADEALYIGDQYRVDVLGARSAGITGILIDRTGYHQDISDCLKISSMQEIRDYL